MTQSTAAVTYTPRFAYAANVSSNNVSAYAINASSGGLSAVAGGPIAAGSNPYAVTVDPTGKFAYVANNGASTLSAYTISAATGALTAVGAPVAAGGSGPVSIAVDPTGRFAYVAIFGGGVSRFVIHPSGALLPAGVIVPTQGGDPPPGRLRLILLVNSPTWRIKPLAMFRPTASIPTTAR